MNRVNVPSRPYQGNKELADASNRKLLVASKVNKKAIIIENWVFIYLMRFIADGPSKKYNGSRLDMVLLTSTTVAADTFSRSTKFLS